MARIPEHDCKSRASIACGPRPLGCSPAASLRPLRALRSYLFLWRQTHGAGKPHAQVALIDIAEATGLSKRAVQDALGRLAKRKLIAVARESITAVPVYSVHRPWRR
jgi:hypothetical protein